MYELDYFFNCPHMSLSDRQELVLKGPLGKKNSLHQANKPFQDLKKDELTRELSGRGIHEGETKEELQNLLKEELHGVQRVPALLYQNPTLPLDSINCGDYKVLGFEPLHDISHHIENVLSELPEHLPKKEASELNALIEFCLRGKETKRAFDYRCALILISNQIRHKINAQAQLLLDTLVEIQEIAYNSDAQRTPRSVLRLHNLTWYHAMLCQRVIGNFKLKKLTVRKFYGTYFHNITSYAPIQNRLISGRSANTEEQERVFNAITNITRTTSSFHGNHIIANIFVCLQAEKHFANHHASNVEKTSTHVSKKAHVSKIASTLPQFANTVIPKDMLVNRPSYWQAHLERISDFLLVGKGIWWNENVHFFDAKGNPESLESGPILHHFRSSSFKSEEVYLKKCWVKCLELKCDLPIHRLQIEDGNGNMVTVSANGNASGDHRLSNTEEVDSDALPCDERANDGLDSDFVVGDDRITTTMKAGGVVAISGDVDGEAVLGNCDVSFNDVAGNGEILGAEHVVNEDTVSKDTCTINENSERHTGNDNKILTGIVGVKL